jgi:pyroglutamyl-peptidase
MDLLLTGFEPFGGSLINPSQRIVEELDGKSLHGISLKGVVLPVDNKQGPESLVKAFSSQPTDCVLCLGEAPHRSVISIERVAINLMDYRIPDNRGNTMTDAPIHPAGPAAYFTTLPVRSILEKLQSEGIPAELSLSAGAYLCNQVFYTLLDHLATINQPIPAGFIHLPTLPEQAAVGGTPCPSMSFETGLKGIKLSIEVISQWLASRKE